MNCSERSKRFKMGFLGAAPKLGRVLTSPGLILALLALVPAQSQAVDPLVLRVQDAIGAPGAPTAIVVRTYASRPIRRGHLNAVAGPPAAQAGTGSPLASFDGGLIFSAQGDVVDSFLFDLNLQTIDAEFTSESATVNQNDGLFAVMFVTLAADLVPGSEFGIALDGLNSFVLDPEEDDVVIAPKEGLLRIRASGDPLEVSAEGGVAQPGSGATIEIGSREPFSLHSGRLVLVYDPAIARSLPEVTVDPRHGQIALTVTYPEPGKVQIDFTSDGTFNQVPGDLFQVIIPVATGVALGTLSPVGLEAWPASFLYGAGPDPLPIAFGSGTIDFELVPDIFSDGFETGDTWVWSAQIP